MLVAALVLILLIAALVVRSVTVVTQDRVGLVERLGRYRRTLAPGLSMVVPILDRVRLVDLREQLLATSMRPVPTKDDRAVALDVRVAYRVTDPMAATYEVASHAAALEQATKTAVGNVVGGLDRERVFAQQSAIGAELRSVLEEVTDPWGLRIERVDVPRIERDEDVRP